MARPKKGQLSKKAAVEKYLGKDMANKDIVTAVKKSHNLSVTPAYVSIIKSKQKQASTKRRGRSRGKLSSTLNGADTLTAAVAFIKAAGSIDAAKQAIAAVEEIRQLA